MAAWMVKQRLEHVEILSGACLNTILILDDGFDSSEVGSAQEVVGNTAPTEMNLIETF
jgi:hypothetical protein